MKIGSHKQTLFAQGSALGRELFGPRGADAQGVALGLSQSFSLLLDDAPASHGGCGSAPLRETYPTAQSSIDKTERNASWGMSTFPTRFIRFFPSFCFCSSLRLREMSPP